MLVSITWFEYSISILIALAIYYIVIAILYYKDKIPFLRFIKKHQQQINDSYNKYAQVDELSEESQRYFQNPTQVNNAHRPQVLDQAEFTASFTSSFPT
jgi:hypothetical protein